MNYFVIAVVISLIILHLRERKKRIALERRMLTIEPTVIKPLKTERIRAAVNNSPAVELPNKTVALDSTKRRSLQPSNQNIIPAGFKEIQRNVDGEVIAFLEQRMPIAFEHKFFGSSLVVDNFVVLSGLTNRLHILEVDEDNKATIDGAPKSLHPDVIERIREQARAK